jgi:hypothetical protein
MAEGEAQVGNKFLQHNGSVVVTALHDTDQPVAADGMHCLVLFNNSTTRRCATVRPAIAQGEEPTHPHEDAARAAVQYSLVYPILVNPVLSLNRSKADGFKPVN